MSTETTAEMATGTASAKNEKSKKVVTKKADKITDVTVIELAKDAHQPSNEKGTEQPKETPAVNENKTKAKKKVVATQSAATATKKVTTVGKSVAAGEKKIKLAATCYHYYRNWLKDFLRSYGGNGVPSARFQKSPESYDGHIVVVESDKAKGLKALEAWNKQNPDTKEMFWDVKK